MKQNPTHSLTTLRDKLLSKLLSEALPAAILDEGGDSL